jgi:ADP-ribosylation factor 2-binding protein
MCFRTRRNELDGEVFEMLFTFSDFTAFKEMFLDYRAVSNYAYCSLVILMKSFQQLPINDK